uniref:Uncharacterized protein n=1 Tax=Rhizophora mucronata TaxID=61149 RepID=A0A2P2LIL9_RHIMU
MSLKFIPKPPSSCPERDRV